jgi:translation initiation factor 2 subunit 2
MTSEKEQDEKYEGLLDKLYSQVKQVKTTERFEIPKVEGMVEGSKTIVTNFSQICSLFSRDCEHVSKFLSRELAAQAIIDHERIIFNRKLLSAQINDKIKAYAEEFVICKECGKPDTELVKEKGFVFLKCLACGAKHSVRSKII